MTKRAKNSIYRGSQTRNCHSVKYPITLPAESSLHYQMLVRAITYLDVAMKYNQFVVFQKLKSILFRRAQSSTVQQLHPTIKMSECS
jgi:hypothetical protein